MRIDNLRSEEKGGRTRVAATVTWEDCDRPSQDLYFETDEEFAQGLTCNPHAFLLACILPAMHHGEQRVFLDGEICPELRQGIVTAMSWIRHWWYSPDQNLVRIEATPHAYMATQRIQERAAFFFSGGVDSLATLRSNRLNYPLEHPSSIKDGLLVYGLEVDRPNIFENVITSLSIIAQNAGITLVPIYTNVRDLVDDWHYWEYEWEGSVFSAIAHSLSHRITVASIASTHDIANDEVVSWTVINCL